MQADALRTVFAGTRVVTAAASDADDKESGLVVHSQKSGEFLLRITRARLRDATLVSMLAFKDAKSSSTRWSGARRPSPRFARPRPAPGRTP
ncbi:hypothetical protein [Streptomyces sp. bgisy032]|uniref:hypothetical protein n=1 Tax=Streptomyces sp. bgisy032 TaxID=3413773 RepID=UPI003D730B95